MLSFPGGLEFNHVVSAIVGVRRGVGGDRFDA